MKKMVALLAGVALMTIASSAFATQITGSAVIAGDVFVNSPKVFGATKVTLVETSNIINSTDDLVIVPNFTPIAQKTFNFNTSSPIVDFIKTSEWSFELLTSHIVLSIPGFVNVQGMGILTDLNGVLEATQASINYTGTDITQLANEIGFAETITAIPTPEPGTMMLLGAGFLGMAIFGKRRKNA